MLFQGQELLEDRCSKIKTRSTGLELRTKAYSQHVRDLIVLRRNLSGKTRGLCGQNVQIYHFDEWGQAHRLPSLGYKQGPTDSVVVVVNMTNQNRDGYVIGFPRPDCGKRALNSDSYNYGPNFAIIPR